MQHSHTRQLSCGASPAYTGAAPFLGALLFVRRTSEGWGSPVAGHPDRLGMLVVDHVPDHLLAGFLYKALSWLCSFPNELYPGSAPFLLSLSLTLLSHRLQTIYLLIPHICWSSQWWEAVLRGGYARDHLSRKTQTCCAASMRRIWGRHCACRMTLVRSNPSELC